MTRTVLALTLAAALPAAAGQPLPYAEGATKLAGYLAKPAAGKAAVPGVVIVHQWLGPTEHERQVAEDLARLGYAALAADIYGEGVRPAGPGEAGKLAGQYKGDRGLFRRRIAAALEALKAQPGVDPGRLAVIGYCFGGTGALEAARGGLPVRAVVSFHGGLDVPAGFKPGPVTAKVLVCHGADDPFVPAPQVAAFQDEMRASRADWQFIAYAGAVHAFTQQEAGGDPSKGAAYQEAAHRRSWVHMQAFLQEAFR